MGTNFYFKIDNREKIKAAIDEYDYETARKFMDDTFIHISKTSGGWLPLFQAHKGLFESVAEIRDFYETNNAIIVDEYNQAYTWDEFNERAIHWNGGVDGVAPKKKYEQDKNSRFYDPDMPNYTPVSHFEYGNGKFANKYFKDPDGFEFTWSEFS